MKASRTTRAAALAVLAGAALAAPLAALDLSKITIERLAQPFMGNPVAQPLTDAEKAELDHLGVQNGKYEIGDLRLFLYNYPQFIPDEQVVLP